jgi:hypothetical protein
MLKEEIFVAMPFSNNFQKVYNDVFKKIIEECNCEPYLIIHDSKKDKETIIEQIHEKIKSCRVLIADITKLNSNVMFEAGYASSLGKDVIYCVSGKLPRKFPFDINQREVFCYEPNNKKVKRYDSLKKKIVSNLDARVKRKDYSLSIPSHVKMLHNTTADADKYFINKINNAQREVLSFMWQDDTISKPLANQPYDGMFDAISNFLRDKNHTYKEIFTFSYPLRYYLMKKDWNLIIINVVGIIIFI